MDSWKCVAYFMMLGAAFMMPLATRAATVEIRLPSGLVGTADYRTGKPGFPAVFLLHGFLQTRNAPPMSRLADTLSDAGYPVLVPTLSLGVSHRLKSLSCEAVHKHTLQEDIQEIGQWVNWLSEHGHRRIAMIGHSSGATGILAYLVANPNALVERAVLVGVTPVEVDAEQYRKIHAEKPVESGQVPPLRRFTMAYCKNNYAATVPAYLSYADWTGEVIANALGRIKVPMEIVLGTKDQVIPPVWRDRLEKSRIPVNMIDNAGHFFDGEYEFELSDRMSEILKKKRH